VFSPDSSQIAYASAGAGGQICVIKDDGTPLRYVTSTATRAERAPDWAELP
jgi:hypothetical protein